ncbi:branched-chain amino acid ABC transporter permease [Caldanaerobacter subterraneus]|uniref:Branched-chain amino acid ABC transporter permease n=3 Tax=Caldanaerobacter subterraneus TaxID=911092 RepID=U5CPT8_CALSX|nr:branched-chain amino acid ABC transporter permease [Caldanaerobacter subterraneus]ERM91789.1 branched-chain amino acid ABC transporter permease [Caldanaerobacter subterraneus subsp. yonseiensis KB-1]KKC30384.1 hypothetical protein CDSM653_00564 [Caldanaerobacter subterraneus subsp. pacificus DSM 12653]NNG66492.1 branched-chain amino acid ABC transporter permease [Caldanaerobacter subterraneus]
MLFQQLISGLATGGLYALTALGLVLIYKTSNVINFAQGEIAMLSTFIAYTAMMSYGMAYWEAFISAILCASILGFIIERFFIRPIQNAPVLSLLIVTLGLMMIINGIAGWAFGFETHGFPSIIKGEVRILGAVISKSNLLTLVVTLVIMGTLFYILKYTSAGIAIRATSENPVIARLMGVSINQVYSISWIIGSVLGAIAGILIAPTIFLDVNMMSSVLLKAFTAAVLGGFTSFVGPVVGGLILGVLENIASGYISAQLSSTFAFALIVIMLWIKPTGLIGQEIRKRV